jgi:hypothetical protein
MATLATRRPSSLPLSLPTTTTSKSTMQLL